VLFRDRVAGLVGATLLFFVSAIPFALLFWGRLTHLAGVSVLPVLITAVLLLDRAPSLRRVLLLGLLLAGLFLIHVRVAVIGMTFVAVFCLLSRSGRVIVAGLAALLVAAILIGPWVVHLAQLDLVRTISTGRSFHQAENAWTQRYVPPGLLWLPNAGLLLSLGTAGLSGLAGLGVSGVVRIVSGLWWVLLVATLARATSRRSRDMWRGLLLLVTWCIAMFLLLDVRWPVDVTRVVPWAAAVLVLFVPVVLACGTLVAWVVRAWLPKYCIGVTATAVLMFAASMAVYAPKYELPRSVAESDLDAFRWAQQHLSPQSLIVTPVRPWFGAFVGADAGYWLGVLTDKQTLLPPALYAWAMPPARVEALNATLQEWFDDPTGHGLAALRAAGVTHVYFASNTDPKLFQRFASLSGCTAVYEHGVVRIVAIRQ
jgi:NADH:ubiquinone oxidoreductase subunit 6 (subunit J)